MNQLLSPCLGRFKQLLLSIPLVRHAVFPLQIPYCGTSTKTMPELTVTDVSVISDVMFLSRTGFLTFPYCSVLEESCVQPIKE
ncbi:hypothetical protein HNY73_016139 [Argiope bruennichi]|uniref:Uncharacterized protein n=1 Tax=Argiope bruennichi TaxID=94029 RepID=A0A8T0EI14_ARGBR|nr:hypothetical protein HNY73_016139 [Argiope bruennichi]